MCNINKKTKYKTRIIYKVCYKCKDNYYSIFAGMKIEIGKIADFIRLSHLPINSRYIVFHQYKIGDWLYNNNLIGRTSGFKDKEVAFELLRRQLSFEDNNNVIVAEPVVLKIKIGGSIFQGDSSLISHGLPNDKVTYAGSEILSFEEIS